MTADNTDKSFFARHEFLILRLHSLSGLIPVGLYMIVHLLTNASVLGSAAAFQNSVYSIHSLGPILPVVEWVFIFLPILFHGIVGLVIIRKGTINTGQYSYANNVRYTLQRATGMIAFVFIMWHVFHMHGWFHSQSWLTAVAEPLQGGKFRPYNAASTAGMAMQQSPLVVALYAVGVLASVFHLANGLWTMGITWGLWTTPEAQSRANWLSIGVGAIMTAVGLSAIAGFATVDVVDAKKMEDEAYEHRVSAHMIVPNDHKRSGAHEEQHADTAGEHPGDHAHEESHAPLPAPAATHEAPATPTVLPAGDSEISPSDIPITPTPAPTPATPTEPATPPEDETPAADEAPSTPADSEPADSPDAAAEESPPEPSAADE